MGKDQRKWWLADKYGITLEQFERLLSKQQGKCAICEEDITGVDTFLRRGIEVQRLKAHVDHDHSSGVVRGLLCNDCNRGLGCFKDSTGRLRNAVRYLAAASLRS
jgi:hypothetical protein